MKQYILLLVLMVMGAGMTVHAEDVNPVKVGNVISGHIIEKGTEASLPYATILIVETGQGTVSDENGEFVFKKIPAGKYTLRVQLLGYETQEKKVTVSNDFTVDIHNSVRLRELVPENILFVSESGMKTRQDIEELEQNGTNAVLIGETLMRSADKKAVLQELRGQCEK